MTVEELRESIERPADVAGLRIESGLVARMLTDAQDEPGHLPLLEFALRELWDRRQGDLLHAQAYEVVGGLAGAIADKAEGLIGKLGPAEQMEVQRLFLRLVRPGQGEKDARRRAAASEFSDAALPLIRRLSDERLLVTAGGPAAAIETVEVAHEALLHRWQRLRGWIDKDRQFMLWQQEVNTAATKWHDGGRQSDFLLRGVPLAQARVWMKQRPEELAKIEKSFIEAGQKRHQLVIGIGLALGGTVFSIIASAVILVGHFYLQAEHARERAEYLVDFMVFDLRDKLAPIGQLDLMKSVNIQVGEYYKEVGRQSDLAYIEHGRIVEWISRGDMFLDQRDLINARRAYEQAIALSRPLASIDSTSSQWRRDLLKSHERLGDVEAMAGSLEQARQAYAHALTMSLPSAKAEAADRQLQRDLSVRYIKLGGIEFRMERWDAAKQAYGKALAIHERLVKTDPANTQWQRDLSYLYTVLAQVHEHLSDQGATLQWAEAGLRISERLVILDPDNATWQRDVKLSRALVARLKP
jgi:tetratricopeptide (TPR) repeat protein